MSDKFHSVDGVKGLRYREHPTRMHNRKADRYFVARYCRNGKTFTEAFGWASEGWNIEKCTDQINKLRTNYRKGDGPSTLAGLREEYKRQQDEEARQRSMDDIRAITFADFFRTYYLPKAQKTKRTWRDDEIRAEKRIIPAIGGIPLDAITHDVIEEFRDSLYADGLADATVLQYLAILRRSFNVASMTSLDGVLLFRGESPVRGIRKPRPENARDRFLTRTEAQSLIDRCLEHVAAPVRKNHSHLWMDLHDAMLLALYAGLRVGEIQRLEWPDVNLFSGHITIRREKDRKPGGAVPANADLVDVFRRRMQGRGRGEQLVFMPVNGGKQRENISHLFAQLVDELGLNADVTDKRHKIVFHSLRHTFASWMALDGVDIYRIKELMRHKTISMTMRYAHLIPDAKRDAVEGISLRNAPKTGQLLHLPNAKTAHTPFK